MKELVAGKSLAHQIAGVLQQEIVDGSLCVAERLPTEGELARRFGVSQPTVREALKILAAKKLIRSKRGPKGGIFVNKPSLAAAGQVLNELTNWFVGLGEFDLGEIIETRSLLGGICVRLAAQRATDSDITEMEKSLEALSDPSLSDEDFCRHDVAFHHAIAGAVGNDEIRFVMLIVNDALIPATNMISFQYRQRDRVIGMHAEILEAIKAGDAEAAASAFDALIGYQSKVYETAVAARDRLDRAESAG